MDIQRARQILHADETITVLHNGSPIWIESLSSKDNTAMVRPMDDRGGVREIHSFTSRLLKFDDLPLMLPFVFQTMLSCHVSPKLLQYHQFCQR
ncbi:MAG: acid-soluble spore protein H [Pelotomaculum sp. PtaU1.Bin065]|nr:MAG: acid-soluble spore protein H [Pelotomaculum sp. PtaU1.Bin065]